MTAYYSKALAHFPLVTYPAPIAASIPQTEERIILWLSNAETQAESLDPLSRQLQSLARFTGRTVESRYARNRSTAYSTRDNKSFDQAQSLAYFTQSDTANDKTKNSTIHAAYSALLNSTLLPAVLATIYLSPPSPSSTPSSQPATPFLVSLLEIYTNFQSRKETIQQIKKLRLANGAGDGILELEELEREGVDCIKNLEEKFEEQGTPGWFCGNRSAPLLLILLLRLSQRD